MVLVISYFYVEKGSEIWEKDLGKLRQWSLYETIFHCNYYCFCIFLGDRVSLYILGWPGICCVDKNGLELWTSGSLLP